MIKSWEIEINEGINSASNAVKLLSEQMTTESDLLDSSAHGDHSFIL